MSATDVTVFNFTNDDTTLSIRTVLLSGAIWFVAADVCRALGLRTSGGVNTFLAVLGADEKGSRSFATPGGPQKMTIISESGLYKLILRAQTKNPAARKFQDWVTRDVLPTIRKTGSYVMGEEKLNDPNLSLSDLDKLNDQIIGLLRRKTDILEAKVAALEAEKVILEPKAEFHDVVSASKGDTGLYETAKALDIKPRTFTNLLRDWGFLHQTTKECRAAQKALDMGVLKVVTVPVDGYQRHQVYVTAKGKTHFARRFFRERKNAYERRQAISVT
jgi:prophage antirepressor-like protein